MSFSLKYVSKLKQCFPKVNFNITLVVRNNLILLIEFFRFLKKFQFKFIDIIIKDICFC